MQNQTNLLITQLQHLTRSFMPDLLFVDPPSDFLLSNQPSNQSKDSQLIKALYESIQASTPEAEHAYWLTRTWTLVCWQPLYVSFISIYALKHLPQLDSFYQRQQNNSVLGICFSSDQFFQGTTEALITKAAHSLAGTFQYYQQILDKLYRCRPHFTQRLLKDAILTVLVQLKEHSPTPLSAFYIKQQAELWLEAFALPKLDEQVFSINNQLDEVQYRRETCCYVHKTQDGDYCQNCPKLI